MKLLVTNDDGIGGPGLHALARALVGAGHDVVVAASLDDRTGSGAAVGPAALAEGIAVDPAELPGLEGIPAFGVDAPPALIVLVARLGAFGHADFDGVASGINPGANTGRALLHSGTVGAALTAANLGLSALAVSQDHGVEMRWETAAVLAAEAMTWLEAAPPRTVLNLNVPNVGLEEVRGVRRAALAPFGTVRTAVTGILDGKLQVEFQAVTEPLDPATDTALLAEGYATLTSVVGVRAIDDDGAAAEALEAALRQVTR